MDTFRKLREQQGQINQLSLSNDILLKEVNRYQRLVLWAMRPREAAYLDIQEMDIEEPTAMMIRVYVNARLFGRGHEYFNNLINEYKTNRKAA